MPVAESLMTNLIKRYGKEKAENVYWGMVGEGKGPFAPGGKHHDEHKSWAERNGVTPMGSKKPRSPRRKKRGSRKR